MPIQVRWMNESQTILNVRFVGEWTMKEFFRFIDEREQLILAQGHLVHLLYDFSESTANPKEMMAGAQYANKHLAPNQGIVVFLKANTVIKAFTLMAKRTGMAATRYLYTAESKEEALKLIEKKANRVS